MQNTATILDNDKLLKELGWEEYFHLTIHYPEQILMGFEEAKKLEKVLPEVKKFYFIKTGSQFNLLTNWLQIISQQKIEIIEESDSFSIPENSLTMKPVYYTEGKELIQSLAIMIKRSGISREILIDLKHIPTNDGNSVFLGAICGVMELITWIDFQKSIKSLVSLLMLKAGVLTWRVPAESNFAKIWSMKLCEIGLRSVAADSDIDFGLVAAEWERLFYYNGGITAGLLELHLRSFKRFEPQSAAGADIIYGDGKEKLEELVSLYHLGVITSIYCALINNKRKEV